VIKVFVSITIGLYFVDAAVEALNESKRNVILYLAPGDDPFPVGELCLQPEAVGHFKKLRR